MMKTGPLSRFSKVFYLPIEEIPSRYSSMMNRQVARVSDVILWPEGYTGYQIENGEFLDVNKTIKFKSLQMSRVSDMFMSGQMPQGSLFILADIFFPGVESIRYMSELSGIKVSIFAFNHAGRADPDDFVQRLAGWSDYAERSWHECVDGVIFGSHYHMQNAKNKFDLPPEKCQVLGMPWCSDDLSEIVRAGQIEKSDFVIWPHRISKEKGFAELLSYARLTDKKIIVTSGAGRSDSVSRILSASDISSNIDFKFNLTKKQYLSLMCEAKYYLSTSHQETFGYTLQEAIYYNCCIAAPNRACYPEMLPSKSLYLNENDIDQIFDVGDLPSDKMSSRFKDNVLSLGCRFHL